MTCWSLSRDEQNGVIVVTCGAAGSFFECWGGSVRYKQTVIGAAWALIRPFLTMAQVPGRLLARSLCESANQTTSREVIC